MAAPHPESNEAVSERLRLLRKALDFDTSSAFAAHLGVSPQRWNNVENHVPLGRDLALTLVQKHPGLTLDWLYRGKTEGLPLALARLLGALEGSGITKTTPR